jgi:hypothetical protein
MMALLNNAFIFLKISIRILPTCTEQEFCMSKFQKVLLGEILYMWV